MTLISVAAAVTLYIGAIFSGGEFIDGEIFTDQGQCNDVLADVIRSVGENHGKYEWVLCEAVTVGPVGAPKSSAQPTSATIETP